MMWNKIIERLTFDTMAAADVAAAAAAAGEMVNASTSATTAACINEERWQVGLSSTAGSVVASASEGGGTFSHGGRVNSMVAMEVWGAIDRRHEVIWADGWWWCGADVASAHAVIPKNDVASAHGVLE